MRVRRLAAYQRAASVVRVHVVIIHPLTFLRVLLTSSSPHHDSSNSCSSSVPSIISLFVVRCTSRRALVLDSPFACLPSDKASRAAGRPAASTAAAKDLPGVRPDSQPFAWKNALKALHQKNVRAWPLVRAGFAVVVSGPRQTAVA